MQSITGTGVYTYGVGETVRSSVYTFELRSSTQSMTSDELSSLKVHNSKIDYTILKRERFHHNYKRILIYNSKSTTDTRK